MTLFALMLDGDLPPDWVLFRWCIYCPLATIAISWVLIRWRKELVVVALVIAMAGGYGIISHLLSDLRFREMHKQALDRSLHQLIEYARSPTISLQDQEAVHRSIMGQRNALELFDSRPVYWVPPYDGQMIGAVWFSAGFPFVLIAMFYFSSGRGRRLVDRPS